MLGGHSTISLSTAWGPNSFEQVSSEVVNVAGQQCWRGQGRDRAPQAATAVAMGSMVEHVCSDEARLSLPGGVGRHQQVAMGGVVVVSSLAVLGEAGQDGTCPQFSPWAEQVRGLWGAVVLRGGLSFTCCWPKWTWGELAVLWEWPMGCGERD